MLKKFPEKHFRTPKLKVKSICTCTNFNFSMPWSSNLQQEHPLTNEVDWWRHQPDHMSLAENDFWSVNYILVIWSNRWCYLSYLFLKGYHWSKFQLHTIYGSYVSRRVDTSSMNHICKKSSAYKGLKMMILHLVEWQLLTMWAPHFHNI